MMTMTEPNRVTRAMLQLQAIDDSAHLRVSPHTGKWYVVANIELSNGVLLEGVAEHREHPDDAVLAMMDRLTEAWPNRHVVVDASGLHGGRRHYGWNGAAFVQQPVPA
jgi:hypothetical protein